MHVKSSVALTHLFQNFKLRKSRWHYVSNAWEGGKIWSFSYIHDIYIAYLKYLVSKISKIYLTCSLILHPVRNVWEGGGSGLSLIYMIFDIAYLQT